MNRDELLRVIERVVIRHAAPVPGMPKGVSTDNIMVHEGSKLVDDLRAAVGAHFKENEPPTRYDPALIPFGKGDGGPTLSLCAGMVPSKDGHYVLYRPINGAGGESREPQADERSSSPLQASSVNPSPASPHDPDALIDTLAARLYFKLEHCDPSDGGEWAELSENERDIYRISVQSMLDAEGAAARAYLDLNARYYANIQDHAAAEPYYPGGPQPTTDHSCRVESHAAAEPEKPVAWMYTSELGREVSSHRWQEGYRDNWTETPLYAAAPPPIAREPRSCQCTHDPTPDEEMWRVCRKCGKPIIV